ncbi:MAG: hypothetical protein HUK06_01495 [Bacteroidaceae bacterium]|nr:hypothetical protein [Bacteroidaceae bacterium]
MAAPTISAPAGSPFIGSPITHVVTSVSLEGEVAFHRLNLKANVSMGGYGSNSFTFSAPIYNGGESVTFDVASALRAIADQFTYTANTTSFPTIAWNLEAWDEYMIDGEYFETGHTTAGSWTAIMGACSDLERIISGGGKSVSVFTRKPSTLPEIVAVGETMVCPNSTSAQSVGHATGQSCELVNITSEGMQTIHGKKVYALPAQTLDRYQFRFVNTLGVVESISLTSLREMEINCTQDNYIKAVQETFGNPSRAIVVKQNDYESWKLTTPPLDEAWLSWYAHEFLMSKQCWVKISTYWIPCHIIPEDTVSGVKRTDGSFISLAFTVQLDINGSPMPELMI